MLDGTAAHGQLCQYVNNDFSIDNRAFHNLTKPEQELILNYTLMIYFCEGTRKKAGLVPHHQHRRAEADRAGNAQRVYTGPWLTHAKSIFSKSNCAAYGLANK
jgi:hypothetical protein